jgi:BON domain-containing protein
MHYPDDRLPLPSEDSGDLAEEPATGETDDYLVAQEEGVPYVPPTERVLSESPDGPDVAGTDSTDAGELERSDMVQPDDEMPARDDELLADAIEALRASDVVAGDRIRLAVNGTQVIVRGEVESIEVSDEVLAIVGDVPGVTDVVDELEVAGI